MLLCSSVHHRLVTNANLLSAAFQCIPGTNLSRCRSVASWLVSHNCLISLMFVRQRDKVGPRSDCLGQWVVWLTVCDGVILTTNWMKTYCRNYEQHPAESHHMPCKCSPVGIWMVTPCVGQLLNDQQSLLDSLECEIQDSTKFAAYRIYVKFLWTCANSDCCVKARSLFQSLKITVFKC